MVKKIKENCFYKISQVEPELLRQYIISEVEEKAKDALYNYLKDLADSYPDFENWYYKTVIPELELKNGQREIIMALSKLEDEKVLLTGIAILKRKKNENKICTFRVHENYRNQGIGTQLFEKCFQFLGTRKPTISISQDRLQMFEKHINNYNFELKQILKGFYKNNSDEYVYNGFLE